MRTCVCMKLALLIFGVSSVGRCADWPQFRGSHSGIADDAPLPRQWARDKNVAWKVRIDGYGWSSPIVWGGKVFVTTAVTDQQRAPLRKGPGGGPEAPPDTVY